MAEEKSLFVEYVRAGAIGELGVFNFCGGRFGIDSYNVIYQDFGGTRQWIECPNDRVREFAIARGIL